jgi:hypothetical protein
MIQNKEDCKTGQIDIYSPKDMKLFRRGKQEGGFELLPTYKNFQGSLGLGMMISQCA